MIADASELAWTSIKKRDAKGLGEALNATLKGWKTLLPKTVPEDLEKLCEPYLRDSHGLLFTGCAGGFLMIVRDNKPVVNGFKIRINTASWVVE